MMMEISFLVFVAELIALCAGLYIGYEHGVRETERRWSEAVAKANYQRELERRA